MTVPFGRGGQDRAALAAGHVDADHGDVGRPPDGRDHRVAQGDRIPSIGDHHVVGEAGLPEEGGLVLVGHHAHGALGAGVARRRQAQRAGLAGPADDGDDALLVLRDHPMCQGRGAAHVHHRQAEVGRQVVGDPGGDRAAEEHGVPVARHLLGPAVPAGQAVLDHERGEGERDERGDAVADRQAQRRLGADLLDGADEHPARAGLRVLHLAAGATMSSTARRTPSPSPLSRWVRSSCRNDAASRLSRSTRIRTSSGQSSLRVSSRSAACGSTTRSSRTRCNPVGSLARTKFLLGNVNIGGTICGLSLDRPQILHLQWHSDH